MNTRFWLVMISLLVILASAFFSVTGVEAQMAGCSTTHIVQRGENLYRIAQRYGTTVAELQARNGIDNPNVIHAGRALCISGGFVPAPTPVPGESSGSYGTVTVYRLNVRIGAGTQYQIVRIAALGERLRLVGRTGDSRWYQVADSAQISSQRWVSALYVRFANPASLPVTG